MSDEQRRPKLWTGGFIRICLIYLVMFLAFHMLMATFAYYVIDIGGSEVTAGLVAGLFSVSAVLIRPIIGWVLDNKCRRIVLLLGLVGLVAFPLSYAACSWLSLVIVLRLLHGLFWSASTTAANVLLCDVVPKERFGEGMGFFGLTSAISTAIAPSIGMLLMERRGFDAMFIGASCCAALGLVLLLSLDYRDPQPAGHSLRESLSLSRLFDKLALPAAVIVFVFLLPYGAVSTFVAIFASTNGLPSGGSFFLVMACASAFSRVLSGRIVDSYGEAPIVWLANGCMAASLLILSFAPGRLLFYLAAILFGLAFGTMPPAMQTMALRIVPAERRGAASSTYLCAFDIGMGLGGTIAGYLIKGCGYFGMFRLMALFMPLSAALYFFWGRRHPSAFHNYQA